MKKFISLCLTLSLLFTVSSYHLSFADDTIINKVNYEGENFITREVLNDSKTRIVIVENDGSFMKAEYDKGTKEIKLSRLEKNNNDNINKKSKNSKNIVIDDENFNNQKFEHITTIDTVLDNSIMLMSNYDDTYNSFAYKEYKYSFIKASNSKFIFDLSIPNDSLRTPMIGNSSRAYDEGKAFKSDLMDADEYTKGAIKTGFGFIPGAGQLITFAGVIESLSFKDLSKADFASALLGAVELIPGLGNMVSANRAYK